MAGSWLQRMAVGLRAFLAAVIALATVAQAWGQTKAPPPQNPAAQKTDPKNPAVKKAEASTKGDADENVFLRADRITLQKLADARQLLADGRLAEAVRYLGDIAEGSEDFFFQPEKDSPLNRSLKSEVQRLIGQMPREGRELYELQYGARARQMLEAAIQAGDASRLAEVSRRFFFTRAG